MEWALPGVSDVTVHGVSGGGVTGHYGVQGPLGLRVLGKVLVLGIQVCNGNRLKQCHHLLY